MDAVTIGGDLWEDEHVSADTRRFVAAELGKLDCPVFLVTGNHDPLLPGGQYERTPWPENVHIFKGDTPSEQRLDGEVSLWGLSWRAGSLSPAFLKPGLVGGDGRQHLLLLHGTATHLAHLAGEGQEGYCAFNPSLIPEAGFSYCLAGHIHSGRVEDHFVYPGSPEPLGWGEMDRHCAALVTITEGKVEAELIDVNEHRYEERTVDCSGAEHSGAVEERIDKAIADVAEDDAGRKCLHLRLVLEGEVEPECEIDCRSLEERVTGFAEIVVTDATEPGYDLEALAEQATARGTFVKALRERAAATDDPDERKLVDDAVLAGLRSLDGRQELLDVD